MRVHAPAPARSIGKYNTYRRVEGYLNGQKGLSAPSRAILEETTTVDSSAALAIVGEFLIHAGLDRHKMQLFERLLDASLDIVGSDAEPKYTRVELGTPWDRQVMRVMEKRFWLIMCTRRGHVAEHVPDKQLDLTPTQSLRVGHRGAFC